jgi:hypothetical protein
MNTHRTACAEGHKRYKDRKAAELLSDPQIDAIVLDACLAGIDSRTIRQRLDEARDLARDGVQLDSRGRVIWAY